MKTKYFRIKIISIFLVLNYLFSACATKELNLNQACLLNAYNKAIKDAEIAEPDEVYKNLVAIVPSNKNLVWMDDQKTYLLVVTWTNYKGYDDKKGQSIAVQKDIWVTVVPEVKNFCKKTTENKTLRLEQLLGLPPNAGETRFVEMWVKPQDLFRPSADPEITDSETERDFRISNKFVKEVPDDYKKWFNDRKKEFYENNPHPWTRLGYTYDWRNDCNHIGLSEFVIIQGSTVVISSISTESQYCQ
jgi:hypothetical protein